MNKTIIIFACTITGFYSAFSGEVQSTEDALDYEIQFGTYKHAAQAVSEASADRNVHSLILGLKCLSE